jgi:DNA-binding transcriptional ArsR family regulator
METVLKWLYGETARRRHIKDLARELIKLLKKGSMTPDEIIRELKIGFKRDKKPKRLFYKVVNPLKEIGLISLRRTKDRKVYYELTIDAFKFNMRKIIENVDRFIKSK